MKRRKKKRTARVLDLHGVTHKDVDEKVRAFLNFVELPCTIIVGKSDKMRKLVESIILEYDWSISAIGSQNSGSIKVVEN